MEESLEYSSPLTWESFYRPVSAAVERQLFPDAVNRLAPTFLQISKLASLPTPEQLGFTWTGDLSPSQNQAFAALWNLKNHHPGEYWAGLRQYSTEQRFITQFTPNSLADSYLINITKESRRACTGLFLNRLRYRNFSPNYSEILTKDPKFTNLKPNQKILLTYIATATIARKSTFTRHI